ncbi:NAD(P)-binding protein [Dendrothele bispora CBS 962.96]|uniref:NAD(P)-binding protein n=1 Tax=Dendrothele bispora (strain CBS 962.96) TaxID=1314807 RepID=A0A4S8M1I4_DENBC|nr:NAD(P)-binding protein [Dendrothele bispora CBS 962.96]
MSPKASSIFFLGATGYLGGQFLKYLGKEHPKIPVYALLRSPGKIEQLRMLHPDVKPVAGSLDDFDIVKNEAAKHPIVVNTASSDHSKSIEATLAGLKEYSIGNPGNPPLYIHTSGLGITSDNSRGEPVPIQKVWSDVGLKLESFNPDNYHLDGDTMIVAAGKDKQVPVRTIIVFPGWIYGVSEGPEKITLAMRLYVRLAREAGHVGTWGPGANKNFNCHVKDVANALLVIFDAALQGTAEEGEEGLYFVLSNNPALTMYEFNSALGDALFKKGFLKTPECKPLPNEVTARLGEYGWSVAGGNQMAQADRIQRLGWKPVVSDKISILESLEEEVSVMLENKAFERAEVVIS